MKTVFLSGSRVGTKTVTSIQAAKKKYQEKYPDHDVSLLDLKTLEVDFSDGRPYLDYDGDTGFLTKEIMAADILFIGSPIFQAAIPATLKNVFDLLPQKALENKTVGIIMTAGSPKHYLIAEIQLKPILAYMKATIVPTYVFIEDKDFLTKELTNDDVLFRLENLVEDTVVLAESYQLIRLKKEAAYGF